MLGTDEIMISESVEKLRRGLKWPRLMDALDFVRTLRKSGKLESVMLMCIIQKDNYTELDKLLDLVSEYCIDELEVAPLGPLGTYSKEEFAEVNVYDPAHRLFEDCRKKVVQAKKIHADMQLRRSEIEAAGKSVPEIRWRVFSETE